MVLNAGDLSNTSFACYMDHSGKTHPLTFTYDAATQALYIKSSTSVPLKFNQVQHVHYGSASDHQICG